jgi:hypothetical protein
LNGLNRKLRDEYGFEPRIDHLAIFGLCRRWREPASEATPSITSIRCRAVHAAGQFAGIPPA